MKFSFVVLSLLLLLALLYFQIVNRQVQFGTPDVREFGSNQAYYTCEKALAEVWRHCNSIPHIISISNPHNAPMTRNGSSGTPRGPQ